MNLNRLGRDILILTSFSLLIFAGSGSTILSSSSQSPDAPSDERVLRDVSSPKMRSLKPVTITAIRNLKSKNWIEDLEIEVRNTSSKPIYAIDIILMFPDIPERLIEGGLRGTVTTLTYGRMQLIQPNELATSEDVPINPGEKFTLKIAEPNRLGLESVLAETKLLKSDIKKIYLRIEFINYGDGTGFRIDGPVTYNRTSGKNSFPRDGPALGIIDPFPSLRQPLYSKKSLAPNIKPVSYSTSSAKPVFTSCSPHVSGCQLYERVSEGCPTPASPCSFKVFYRDATALTPNPICIGHIKHSTVGVTCGGATYQCVRDTGYTCEEWESCGRCPNVNECLVCSGVWLPGSCTCDWGDGGGGGGGGGFCDPSFIICEFGVPDPETCLCSDDSPIVIDTLGNGFDLTDANSGVRFDLDSDGDTDRLAWTSPGSDDAWLALDRNANGRIDNGRELFGNYTPQPQSNAPNGFLALAEYDRRVNGGNNDGRISNRDSVFASLRLWKDVNHKGISEANELHALPNLGLTSIDLDYRESRRRDEHGNWFRYRAKVRDARGEQLGRWAWDVFLVSPPLSN
ncbi:MAG TPA: hypothetical protein VKA70_15430 [Blastocatellia bacterium]|nr:hypothetical protein [Blastocatellia bacterium]